MDRVCGSGEIDPRLSVIEKRLEHVNRVVGIISGKGGVGKTLVSTTLALVAKRRGFSAGLLDLDFHGPTCHRVLDAKVDVFPEEEYGVVAPDVHGIKFMSLVYYAGDEPIPLRGKDVTNVIIELLTITRWGNLDFLFIDFPPGMGEELLDMMRIIRRIEFIVVTSSSSLSYETVKRLVKLLIEVKANVIGVVENMVFKRPLFRDEMEEMGIRYLGNIKFYPELEQKIGDVSALMKSNFAKEVMAIFNRVVESV